MSFTMFETSRLVALLLFFIPNHHQFDWCFFLMCWRLIHLGALQWPKCHWCGLGLGLVRWMELIIFISLVEVLALQLLALLVSPWQVDWLVVVGMGWDGCIWTYGSMRRSGLFEKPAESSIFYRVVLGCILRNFFWWIMDWEQNLKDSKTALNGLTNPFGFSQLSSFLKL